MLVAWETIEEVEGVRETIADRGRLGTGNPR